jgi:hypothetical protein
MHSFYESGMKKEVGVGMLAICPSWSRLWWLQKQRGCQQLVRFSLLLCFEKKKNTEGLQVFCVEDQQMLLLPLIFYAISQKTISINLSGYWVCFQDINSEFSCTTKHGRLFFCQLVTVQTRSSVVAINHQFISHKWGL